MSHSTSPNPRRLTLATLPPEIQWAICSLLDKWSRTRLEEHLDFDPYEFTYHHILNDRELASAPLIPANHKEMSTVAAMSQTNRHFRNLLGPYLYSRYGPRALRYCFLNGGRETLHRVFELRGMPSREELDQLLIAASALRNEEIAHELIRLGATVSVSQASKFQPTDYSVSHILPSLFQFAPNDFNRGLHGSNPLMSAVGSDKNHEEVRYLLSQGAVMNLSFCDGALPLHEAITNAAERNVQLLLEKGACPNYRDTRRSWRTMSWSPNPTAMEVALFFGSEQIFFSLLEHGADLSSPRVSRRARHTLEMMALRGTGSKLAAAMFANGLPVELSKPKNGRTFLHSAAQGGDVEWLDVLLKTGQVDINALTDNQNTAIEWAHGKPHVQRWLMDHGSLPPRRRLLDVADEDEDYEDVVGEWW